MSIISGALYHRVLTYSVNGGRDRISLAKPKSISLTLNFNIEMQIIEKIVKNYYSDQKYFIYKI